MNWKKTKNVLNGTKKKWKKNLKNQETDAYGRDKRPKTEKLKRKEKRQLKTRKKLKHRKKL